MATELIKLKCMSCGLHFTVFSWSDDWMPKACPECAGSDNFMMWRDKSERQIYEFVPGSSPLHAIGV